LSHAEPLRGDRLEALLARMPDKPGVYLMKDLRGRVVYVGKANSLRKRVRTYFRASGDDRPFVSRLDGELGDIEVIVTPSGKDALILERKLVQLHQPRYNADLIDDKNFLSIRIGTQHAFPRLMMDRRRPRGQGREQGGRWFGPYPSALAARKTFRIIQSTLQLRTCNDRVFESRSRPCLLYQMGRCMGPCVLDVSRDEYEKRVRQAVLFLRGREQGLVSQLEERMRQASSRQHYEEAARLRDQISAVQYTVGNQPVIDPQERDRDLVGVYREGRSGMLLLMQIRRGNLMGASRMPFSGTEAPNSDVIRQVLVGYYDSGADLPGEVVLPSEALAGGEGEDDLETLQAFLSERRGGKVTVWSPLRGRARKILSLAHENAREAFEARLATASILVERLQRLQRVLGLSRPPRRIECFDLSTLGGRLSVGAMAVLIDGEPDKSAYRRFRIKEAALDSDVGMMREVISRRYRPVLEGREDGPDLIVLDGGRGHLNTVQALFDDMGVSDVDMVALAKGRSDRKRGGRARERVFVPGRKNPILLRPQSDELFLLGRVRDEAHRFAIEYHRKLRRKTSLRSVLEEISGVGPVLRRRLLRRFSSLQGVRRASVEQMEQVKGVSNALARRIHSFLDEV